MKAKIRTSSGVPPSRDKVAGPTKPGQKTQIKTGFLAKRMGNAGVNQAHMLKQTPPHASGPTQTPRAYAAKDRPELPRAGKKRGMY